MKRVVHCVKLKQGLPAIGCGLVALLLFGSCEEKQPNETAEDSVETVQPESINQVTVMELDRKSVV